MAWTLEAEFALAALLLTFTISGVSLLLKHRKYMPYLRNSKVGLLQEPVEGMSKLVVMNMLLT